MFKNWRWFISKTLREAVDMHKQVHKLLAAQRDLIKEARATELIQALDALAKKLAGPVNKQELNDEMNALMATADRVLIPYPDPKARDWVEMFLVVAVLVLAFRTFFFQPFKIPTGSMQPTLYGITVDNLKDKIGQGSASRGILTAADPMFSHTDLGRSIEFADGTTSSIVAFQDSNTVRISSTDELGEQDFQVTFKLPSFKGKAVDKLRGYSYHTLRAEGNWQLVQIDPPKSFLPLVSTQKLTFRDVDSGKYVSRKIWFPPLNSHQQPILGNPTDQVGQPRIGEQFNEGEFVLKLRVKTGDHLFVNRVTFNFRQPRRGEICVFSTKGVPVTGDPNAAEIFYIKRLIAKGGDSVSIGTDRHVNINGRRFDANDPGFEFIYDFPLRHTVIDGELIRLPRFIAMDSVYSGHVNNSHEGNLTNLAPLFPDHQTVIQMKPNHYLMFGDNTTNSSDSRNWGQLPKQNVIGKSSLVYWPPLSPRFGWSHR